ncbi:hypothetical protein EMGBS15_08960 [Filimonas sp.]|jgi:hypothetical protein|nr:hypothetical protein EMGBS15_08960 [Filimonas sp.]
MKKILLLLLLPFTSLAQSHDQYIVTKSNDTIFYKGDLIVNHDDISKWRNITADEVSYSVSEIKAAHFNHHFYYNCDGRHLYKQVVNGKINVYALNDKDTLPDRHGNLRKQIFIEHQGGRKPVVYTFRNLMPMVADNDSLSVRLKDMNARRNGGNAMIITGMAAGIPSVVGGLFVAFIRALFDDGETTNDALTVAGAGVVVGGGLISGGAALKAGTGKVSLNTIHWYNAQ